MDEEPKRYRVEFATGTAAAVAKRRSYRDHERNDIEPGLPGWPPGQRAFAVRGFFGRLGQYVLGVVTAILMLPLYILADALGSPRRPPSGGSWRSVRTRSTTSPSYGRAWARRLVRCPGSSIPPGGPGPWRPRSN